MNWSLRLLPVVFTASLAACATSEKRIEPNASPRQTVGYVAGDFSLKEPPFSTAFVLTSTDNGQEYILPFTRRTDFPSRHRETSIVELPPGTYRATHWVVFNAFWGPGVGGREFKAQLDPSTFTQPFKVEGGQVIFLGRFLTESQWTPGYLRSTTRGRWEAKRISAAEAQELIARSYPNFAGAEFTCLTCTDRN